MKSCTLFLYDLMLRMVFSLHSQACFPIEMDGNLVEYTGAQVAQAEYFTSLGNLRTGF